MPKTTLAPNGTPERPMQFDSEEVRAIIGDRKTQMRLAVKLPRERGEWKASTVGGRSSRYANGTPAPEEAAIWNTTTGTCMVNPYGPSGDRVWVRETWHPSASGSKPNWTSRYVLYAADNEGLGPFDGCCIGKMLDTPVAWTGMQRSGWHPALHMPRWASRITLEVTEVRVERVQAITENDALAEDVPKQFRTVIPVGGKPMGVTEPYTIANSHLGGFANRWDSLNSRHGNGWDLNPWVWAITIRRITASEDE
ncbi:MAG: hypothetical protein ACR2M1_08340 [Gemmatimonadaceae bacterium]